MASFTLARVRSKSPSPPLFCRLLSSVQVVPFKCSEDQAKQEFLAYHGSGWLYKPVSSVVENVEQLFLPFWVYSGRVVAHTVSAQIGEIVWSHVYNSSTKRTQLKEEIAWRTVSGANTRDVIRVYSPQSDAFCQVYGSFHYRRHFMEAVAPLPADFSSFIAEKQPWSSDVLSKLSNPRVEPFTMGTVEAKNRVWKHVKRDVEEQIASQLRILYRVPHVRNVTAHFSEHRHSLSPIYYPVYLFKQRYWGRRMRTFVNGVQSHRVSGIHAYNPVTLGAAGALGYSALNFFLPTILPFGSTVFGGILSGGVLGVSVAVYLPLAQKYYSKWRRKMDQFFFSKTADETTAGSSGESSSARESYRYSRQYSEQQASTSSQDSRGYYATLNVPKSASTAEIQSAFRALALKHHPDKFKDPNEKQKAKVKFQRISEAYTVLKDPKRRRDYDCGSG